MRGRTEGVPGVRLTDARRQKEEGEEAAPQVWRTEEAPRGGARRSESLAEKRRGPLVGSAGVRRPRPPEKWSWSEPAGGRSERSCVWRDAREGRGCEEAAPADPRSRRWTRGREEAGRSVGGGPTAQEAWEKERRGGSDLLSWEPEA